MGIRERILAGEVSHGSWLSMGSATAAEMMGLAGFDWVMIDLEHGWGQQSMVLPQMRALSSSKTSAFVRVSTNNPSNILQVLDLGAVGVMVPQIQNVKEAREAVASMHYPPRGKRGMVGFTPATKFGLQADQYREQVEDQIVGIIQIETASVLQDLDAIAAIEGADVLFIGPGDLTLSLGIYGQFDHPKYLDAIERTVRAAKSANKAVGILLFDIDDYYKYRKMGITVIAAGSDAGFIMEGARLTARRLQEMREQ